MRIFKGILIILIFFSGCDIADDNKKEDQIRSFNLKTLPKTTDVRLSDLGFVEIEYIPLETNTHSMFSGIENIAFNLMGNLYKIISGDDYFLIKDCNTILKFRNDGAFIDRIGTIGRGPEEFTVANDIIIDKEDSNIYVFSAVQRKANVYSEDGEFIRTFQLPIKSNAEFRFTNGEILCYCDNNMGEVEDSYILLDKEGNIIKTYPNEYPFTNFSAFGFAGENLFYQYKSRLYSKEVYSDTIYLFENMKFTPHMVIEVGERLITPEARSKYEDYYLMENYINPLNLFEFGDYIYYEFIYEFVIYGEVSIYGFIGSKNNNFQALFDLEQGIINDLDGGPNIWPKMVKDDNIIISCVDALKLKNHVESDSFKNSFPKYPEKKKELEILSHNIKETDNPILMIIKMKE